MSTSKLRRIRKLWHKGLRSLPGVDGKRHRKSSNMAGYIPAGRNTDIDVTPDDVNQLAKVLGDSTLAARLRKLQREQYPYGTMPELLMLDYLQRRGENYIYQVQLFGGDRAGGLVPDFVVSRAGGWMVLAIQGIYWHNIPGKRQKDEADKMRMIGTYYQGQVITGVVFVWENRIMTTNPQREQVLELSLMGIETGA